MTKEVKSVGSIIDELYVMRLTRSALQKEADKIKAQETELSKFLITELEDAESTAMRGKKAMFSISKKVVPTVEDWNQVYAFVKETDAFDLFPRSINASAWTDRLENRILVPGTAEFTVTKSSLTKAK